MGMNFISLCSTRYLTRLLRSLVRYQVDHSKIKFISTYPHGGMEYPLCISSSISLVRSFRTTTSRCLLMWSGSSLLFLSRTLSWFSLQSWRVTMRPSPFDPMMLTSSQIAYPLDFLSRSSSLRTTDSITNNKMMQQWGSLCMQQFLTST